MQNWMAMAEKAQAERRCKMTLSAWRPLKDAPHVTYYTSVGDERFIVHYDLKEALGEVSCAFADVAHGDADDVCDIELGILVPIARGEEGSDGPTLAHVAELDRAVQGEIARAFGELLAGVKSTSRPTNQYADVDWHSALARTRTILHTAMGGRIPDEVP